MSDAAIFMSGKIWRETLFKKIKKKKKIAKPKPSIQKRSRDQAGDRNLRVTLIWMAHKAH